MFSTFYHVLSPVLSPEMTSGEQSPVTSRPPAMRSCMQYDTAHYTVCIIQVGLNPPYCTILDPPWHEIKSF